jgi:hypothetical protein
LSNFFSINSTFFQAVNKGGKGKVSVVPVLRSATIFGTPDSMDALVGRIKAATWGWQGKKKRIIRAFMLRFHRKVVVKSPVSLTRGYGLSVGEDELVHADILRREVTCLLRPEVLDHPNVSVPVNYIGVQADVVMGTLREEGFKERPRKRTCKACQSMGDWALADHFVEWSWTMKEEIKRKEKERKGGEKIELRRNRASHHLLGLSASQFKFWWWTDAAKRGVWQWIWGRKIKKRSGRLEGVWCPTAWLCQDCQTSKLEFIPAAKI